MAGVQFFDGAEAAGSVVLVVNRMRRSTGRGSAPRLFGYAIEIVVEKLLLAAVRAVVVRDLAQVAVEVVFVADGLSVPRSGGVVPAGMIASDLPKYLAVAWLSIEVKSCD